MVEDSKELVLIDLNQFKLHISLTHHIQLTLHFNSPSRSFYLSVIALVVNEMKKLGKVTSIPLEEHIDLLALLNETVGGSAGGSTKEKLLPRIYRKWKNALPDLEEQPLFKVLGRKKDYVDESGETYRFSEAEKDLWANLFEYKGSGEHIRLRFSIDKLGASLNDVAITYGEYPKLVDEDAWGQFVAELKQKVESKSIPKHPYHIVKRSQDNLPQPIGWKAGLQRWWKWAAVAAMIGILMGAGALAIWNSSFYFPNVEVASLNNKELALPNKPSIAVLPFDNLSGDPKQGYFSDGITDEIITALSKTSKLFVIARQSTFAYKGKPVKVQHVAKELGVRFVLGGSVRKSEDRVRITAQLVDALTGNHLWAERYDRSMKDILAVQDEITMKIIAALRVHLTEGEQARVYGKGTDNLEAYLLCLQGAEQIRRMNKDGTVRGRQMAEKAIALDPNYALAYRLLATTYANEVALQLTEKPRQSIARATNLTQKALALDESLASAHSLLGWLYTLMGQHDKGISECERGVLLEPNSALAHFFLSLALRYAGRAREAITMCKEAIRLDPIPVSVYYQGLTNAYCLTGQHEEAITAGRKAVHLEPNNLAAHAFLTAAHSLDGQEEEALIEAREILRISPKFSVEHWAKTMPYKNPDDLEITISGLLKAGLK